MSDNHKNAIAFVCSDGRLHHGEVNLCEKIRTLLEVDFVYIIAVPGPDGVLKKDSSAWCKTAREEFELLNEAKHPIKVAIVGHCDCAGHPVSDEEHEKDVAGCVETIKSWGFGGEILGLLAEHNSDTNWPMKKVL